MELKHISVKANIMNMYLLIVPYGIETRSKGSSVFNLFAF